jgi:hypothetical protein
MLEGRGISLQCEGAADPAIGFYTARVVRASDPEQAQAIASKVVLAEWLAGGKYAVANSGSVPSLTTDRIYTVSLLRGIFGRKPGGYSFYLRDD